MSTTVETFDIPGIQDDLSDLRALTEDAHRIRQEAVAITQQRNDLLRHLHAQGLTQQALAAACGVSHAAIAYALGRSKRQKAKGYQPAP